MKVGIGVQLISDEIIAIESRDMRGEVSRAFQIPGLAQIIVSFLYTCRPNDQ